MPEPMELSDIIIALNAYVGGDKNKAKEAAKELRAQSSPVAQHLINVGAGQKSGEVQTKLDELQKKLDEATEHLEGKETELAELRAKTPDAASIEASAKNKYEKQLRKVEAERDTSRQQYENALRQVAIDKAVALLITPNEQGLRVDREYAQLIAAEKLRPHILPKPDGNIGIKQLGDDGEYDGGNLDEKVAALVKDFRPYIPPTFVMSNADSGAGIRGGSAASVSSGLKTQQQIIEQYRTDPTFAGI